MKRSRDGRVLSDRDFRGRCEALGLLYTTAQSIGCLTLACISAVSEWYSLDELLEIGLVGDGDGVIFGVGDPIFRFRAQTPSTQAQMCDNYESGRTLSLCISWTSTLMEELLTHERTHA